MKLKTIFCSLMLVMMVASCSTPKDVTYMQDLTEGEISVNVIPKNITVRPGDKISIVVNSREAELADLFNLPIISHRVGTGTQALSGAQSQYVSYYTVDPQGNIDFPVLGKIHISGMTRSQVAEYIKQQLVSKDLLKGPIVTMEYANTGINIMGEVTKPGRYDINKDQITILEALSLAGDLTITGKRHNVLVTRQVDGKTFAYRVDLTDSKSLYSSPAYYIQPDDVIYVEPVDVRKRQRTVNGNNVLSASFWVSVASLLTSVAVLIFK